MPDTYSQDRDGLQEETKREVQELKTVESQRNDLTAEEFPEGPYGMDLPVESLGKSSPWRESQHSHNQFTYENRELHAGLSREYPGAHPTHDSSGDNDPEE